MIKLKPNNIPTRTGYYFFKTVGHKWPTFCRVVTDSKNFYVSTSTTMYELDSYDKDLLWSDELIISE